jgi:hypothetical protein
MAEPPKKKLMASAEAGARHLLLMLGFGVAAFVGGTIVSAALVVRVFSRLDGGSAPLHTLAAALVDGAWVMAALPLIAYFSARFMELKPWSTAGVGAFSGLVFQLALQYVSLGEEGIFGEPARLVGRVVTLGLGVFFTAKAVQKGRAAALAAEAAAKTAAEAKKTQYDEFVKQAEALADRREQVPIVPPPAQPDKPAGT